ncbi:MAG: DNA-binding response regulator [bacterium]|jgi:DNA-binding response OmpR family regulator/DNA-binding CsgD family transcriptional regulator|nr:DNA-binding response regulator [bacterium]
MDEKTILIVDDQREIIRMIASELKARNGHYRVINASNGEIGVKVAEEELPDMIIMDWDMPVMNGIEATRTLKNNEATHDIPVIMATGQMTSSEDLKIALEAGAVDYIRKPVDFVELTARINTAIRIKEQHEAIQELLKNEIELKNRKLSTTSMLIVEKNGLLQDFHNDIEQLEKIASSDNGNVSKELTTLRKRIHNHIDIDSSWETFKLHFDEVHPHFFSILHKRYGEISHKDLKLCAYLKLGMDNKQIARLLNISPSSTRTALTRLKKKMGLSEEDHLRNLIMEIS